MSIFLGLIVHDQVPRDRYIRALTEIEQLIYVHKEELVILNSDNILKFKIQNSVFWLPKNPIYLNTIYYRITGNDDLQSAIELIWDCLCILKENFPSKLELYQENIDEFNLKEWENELLRRQLNNLNNRQSNEPLTKDEIEDVFAILNIAQQLQNVKGQEICLNLLNQVQPFFLQTLSQSYLDQLEQIAKGQHKIIANSLLNKIIKVTSNTNNQITQRPNNHDQELINFIRQNPRYEQQFSNSSIIFQMKETNEIDRICFYLDYTLCKNQMLLKSIKPTIQTIIEKYYDGQYGLGQSELTKYCVFHTLLGQTILNIQQFDTTTIQKIFVIFEEGILNWIQSLVQMSPKQIYTLFPSTLLQIYQNQQYSSQIKSHKSNIFSMICNKMGMTANNNKSDQQKIYQNLDEIKCISPLLAQFLEQLI
ncbi:unnamed protein product (macronuclear) [Paramecium tetraurelia]|uniref:Chromosome undetermined scaffold_1, whole genome shotgun sequence n=1 Tax=Paramecium tetraurelia TaxID=5888 RepID=Q6BFJ0_PARTE|nr:hypothetical protein [Paramecium tetraurelia strain d4-2]XP_001423069.1 uncharacterized protein GSPATT00000106001 [Paramecium tetraurelia]CAH03580.1 hypothetical protein PTMB.383 [Paramecium tetraurelia]CAK55671.1 unnamed protein product [Paramecium tetraurelia]|eukprot:XP_001423069.1 hypothetical protein (macronuclear) [Paramecium tetraurelia strain d4-2]